MKRPARVPSQLSESLHKRLNAYALAASAAGVSLLALTQTSEARIVYTPANIKIHAHQYRLLDVNHDGVRDFVLSNRLVSGKYCSCATVWVHVFPRVEGNQIWGVSRSASDLSYGVQVGSNSKLAASHTVMFYSFVSRYQSRDFSLGLWKNATNRYLGLKFVVKGTTHYGWARLSLKKSRYYTLTLTGYAYETIPNKPIKAGQIHSENEATLGGLAQGASAVLNRGKP
jgi:hypothetical protein